MDKERQLEIQAETEQIRDKLELIKHKVLVLSGKGGVGKSVSP